MIRPARLLLLAAAVAATVAATPAETSRSSSDVDAPAGATVEEGTFPIGVCAWARPVSPDKFCVIVNDPRPYVPPVARR